MATSYTHIAGCTIYAKAKHIEGGWRAVVVAYEGTAPAKIGISTQIYDSKWAALAGACIDGATLANAIRAER